MLASEVLIEAKKKFGRFGQNWTRLAMKRPGLYGENYCSLGAIRATHAEATSQWSAETYLKKAIKKHLGEAVPIPQYNDLGRAATSHIYDEQPGDIPIPILLVGITRFLGHLTPGFRVARWFTMKKVWCDAIQMAVNDELQQGLHDGPAS